MKKPHWEASGIRDVLKQDANKFKIHVPGAGVGPISDAAFIRRIYFLKTTTTSTMENTVNLASSFPISENELVGDKAPAGMTQQWNQSSAYAAFIMFMRGGEHIYKIGREFGEALMKADLEIKAELLPELPYFFCVEFPDHIRFHDSEQGDYFHCVYVALQKKKPGIFRPIDRHGKELYGTMDMIIPCYTESGELKNEENNTTFCFREKDELLSASRDRANDNSTHPINCPEVFEYLLKFLVYLGSGEPDLREYRAPKPTSQNVKKLKRWHRDHASLSLLDMTLVGFSWKKPRVYKVGETTVTGHPRWQPWGPGKTKVKLIWIEPHIRHYGDG